MRRCWAYQPSNRPTFHQIVLELSKMLEDGIEYLKLDVPSVSNPGYDYFSQPERAGSEMVNLSPLPSSPITGTIYRKHLLLFFKYHQLTIILSLLSIFIQVSPKVDPLADASCQWKTYD